MCSGIGNWSYGRKGGVGGPSQLEIGGKLVIQNTHLHLQPGLRIGRGKPTPIYDLPKCTDTTVPLFFYVDMDRTATQLHVRNYIKYWKYKYLRMTTQQQTHTKAEI